MGGNLTKPMASSSVYSQHLLSKNRIHLWLSLCSVYGIEYYKIMFLILSKCLSVKYYFDYSKTNIILFSLVTSDNNHRYTAHCDCFQNISSFKYKIYESYKNHVLALNNTFLWNWLLGFKLKKS